MAFKASERKQVQDALDLIERETTETGSKVILKGFGTFERKLTPAHTGRNPLTGEAIEIPARSTLRFSPSGSQKREE